MDKFMADSVRDNLIQVLVQGRQLSKQLQRNLHAQHPFSSSDEISEYLLHKISHSYDHALSMLQNGSDTPPPPMSGAAVETIGSPQTDDSDKDLKGQQDPIARDEVLSWRPRIEVFEQTGIEGQLEDGYRWRKYGQKDILGAKYPRGYYGCIHKHDQGCPATKQVQRSDKDPILLEITYKRNHTCNQLVDNPPGPNNDQNPSLGPEQYDPNRYPESFDPFSFPSVNSAHSQCELSKIFTATTYATESESNFSFGELGWYPK